MKNLLSKLFLVAMVMFSTACGGYYYDNGYPPSPVVVGAPTYYGTTYYHPYYGGGYYHPYGTGYTRGPAVIVAPARPWGYARPPVYGGWHHGWRR